MCIVRNKIYEDLSFTHINNNYYDKLRENPMICSNDCSIIRQELDFFVKTIIFRKDQEKDFIQEPKLGKSRLLFKLHKSKFSVRPIINSI